MNFTPTEWLALDTNEYILALRPEPLHMASQELFFGHIARLRVHMPLHVLRELNRNLSQAELNEAWGTLFEARDFQLGHATASAERMAFWHTRGAKKGDAIITAQLEAAGIRYFVSENRHFLAQIANLPFEVMDAATVLRRLR